MTANHIEDRTGATKRFTYHGGDLAAARAAFPEAPQPWIDLSTGINGRPYPVGSFDPDGLHRLPEPAAILALEAAAARAYGAHGSRVIAAPGTQALIQWLPRLFPARRVGILGFSYAEHSRAWDRAGAHVDICGRVEDLEGYEVAVVVNPNNPDGRLVAPEQLLHLGTKVGLLVVDEAFADALPQTASLVPLRPERGTIVLRSFGKFFGLAGLRLGFAVASPDLGPTLRDALGPWAVSGPAIELGCRALADAEWRADTAARLAREAERLDALVAGAGAAILGGTTLFRLAQVSHGSAWFEHLGRAGILVRPFAEHPSWLRFGIPAADWQWDRLAEALRQAALLPLWEKVAAG